MYRNIDLYKIYLNVFLIYLCGMLLKTRTQYLFELIELINEKMSKTFYLTENSVKRRPFRVRARQGLSSILCQNFCKIIVGLLNKN